MNNSETTAKANTAQDVTLSDNGFTNITRDSAGIGKRIVAWAGIAILVGMYIMTLIFAITDNSSTKGMFYGSIAVTVFVPVVIYAYSAIYRYLKNKANRSDS